MLLVKKLVRVNDAFRLRQEMLWMMGSALVIVGKKCEYILVAYMKQLGDTLHLA